MFRRCNNLKILFVVTLQTFAKFHAHSGCKIWVLTEGFLPSSPSRVTKYIYIRRGKCKSFVNAVIALTPCFMMFCSSFIRNCTCRFKNQIRVKCRSHTYCLRKNCSYTCPCNTVQALVPPIIFFYSKSFYGRCVICHLPYFFLDCHLFN